jgi:regulator of protease activity HflC (stomatin/prohibitin superfamily)
MDEETKGYVKSISWGCGGILGIVLIIGFFMSLTRIDAGFVGVVTRWGAVYRVAYPGITWKVPIADGVHRMDVRTQKDQVDASAASRDLQTVTSVIAVNYHLDGQYATNVYQSVGIHYPDILIAPAVQSIFKATTAKYTAEELITKREQVRLDAEQALTDQLITYHVVVENFNIVNFDFSPEFNAAIEAKVTAQQQVETAKQLLAKTKVDAETALAQAQGQANAQAALKNTGALSPEYLEYLALQKWNGILPLVTSGATPFIDITEFSK